MKKAILAAALGLVALIGGRAHAAAGAGLQSFELGASTANAQAVFIASGAGYLYRLDISSGAAADWCTAIDSAGVSGVVTTTNADGTAANPKIATVVVAASNTSTSLPQANWPVRFVNGLVVWCNAAARQLRASITIAQ